MTTPTPITSLMTITDQLSALKNSTIPRGIDPSGFVWEIEDAGIYHVYTARFAPFGLVFDADVTWADCAPHTLSMSCCVSPDGLISCPDLIGRNLQDARDQLPDLDRWLASCQTVTDWLMTMIHTINERND